MASLHGPAVGKLPSEALSPFAPNIAMQTPSPRLRPSAYSLQPTAFTLIEMLVSLAITMIMMGAVVSLFGLISDSVSGSRSVIETAERLAQPATGCKPTCRASRRA